MAPLKNRLCQYGNCPVETTFVIVNYNSEEKPAFCSATHAALWLLRREGHTEIAASLEAKFGSPDVHKLVIKPRSSYTVCGVGIVAYYPNSATAMTNEGQHIQCTENKAKVTCERCAGRTVRREAGRRFKICSACCNPHDCMSWQNCHNKSANPIGEKP